MSVKLVAKSKSMVSEEIELNAAFRRRTASTWSKPISASGSSSSGASARATW